uniref:ubiquitinyl hydrolase 1 n=1 Tax=Phascolarctos cinereus TaxID=38626 RepID=A0A6P5LV24_PHACI|nr:ataxin-3 isoform X5 [Phascolarctos cinereus]
MESIFHEKQEGSLCAQHCLNNLLQGEYFSPVELSSIAHQLDEEERMRMAEGGVTSEDYRTFLQQPSGNMDDSGFFSIQVISNALKVWGLELILFNSPEYQRLGIDPINERSFICNYKEHWFTVRKLGKQRSLRMAQQSHSCQFLVLSVPWEVVLLDQVAQANQKWLGCSLPTSLVFNSLLSVFLLSFPSQSLFSLAK